MLAEHSKPSHRHLACATTPAASVSWTSDGFRFWLQHNTRPRILKQAAKPSKERRRYLVDISRPKPRCAFLTLVSSTLARLHPGRQTKGNLPRSLLDYRGLAEH